MYKKGTLILFFIITNTIAQKQGVYDSILVNSFKDKLSKISKKIYKVPLDSSHTQLNTLLISLEKKFPRNKELLNKQETELKYLYEKGVVLLIGSIHIMKAQYDSVNYYNGILEKQNANAYWLGRSESILAYTKKVEKDFIGYIKTIKKSLNYYKESKHKSAKYRRLQLLMELINHYKIQELTLYAKELIPVIKYEFDNFNDKKRIESFKIELQLIEISLLINEDKQQEAINLLDKVDITNIKNHKDTSFLHEKLISIYFKLGDYDNYLKYFNLYYENPFIKRSPLINIFKHYELLKFSLVKEDLKEAKKHIEYLDKNPHPSQNRLIAKHKSYAKFYELTKNYKLANKSNKRITILQDSIFKSNLKFFNKLNIYNLTYEKELVRLEKENVIKENIIAQEKLKNIYIALLMVFVMIVTLLTFFFFRKKKQLSVIFELKKTKEILTYKNTFLENISHEMRTPITIVLGYLSLIQNKILDSKKVLQYSNIAISNSEQLIVTLNNFLKVSQLENNADRQIILESRKLNSFLIGIVTSFSANAELKNIKLLYKSNIKKDVIIEYEYDAIQKILENLISNALKYSNSNTSVYIQNTIDEKNITLSVKDEGVGIKEEDQKNIFNKFYQSKEHTVTGGFGIGLSLVYELVNHLKGTIILNSKLNVGSIFTVAIPHQLNTYKLFTENIEQDFSLITTDYEEETIPKNLPLALIIDDNLEMISYYKELLSNSLHCFFAFNGNEALEIINNEAIDIIISDYRMPIMDGIEFKKALNKDNNFKDIPFIMVTAVAYDFVNDPKMKLGLNDYIAKPFDKNELKTRIRSLLENKMYITQLLSDNNTEEIVFKNEYSELLDKVNTIIRENLNNSKFDVKTLASECGYTQRNLNNILQKATGLTLVKTVLEIRLQKAYEFIINNAYSSLSEIMFETGFNSRPYFYKKFENRFGIKPGELKKKYS